jgi:copper transport protein
MAVLDAAGHKVQSDGPYQPGGAATKVAERVPPNLPAGGYVVTWRVISADSHPVHGAFTFVIGAGTGSAAAAEASKLNSAESGSRSVGWVYGAVRAIEYGAVALFLGGAAVIALAWPESRRDRRLRNLVGTGWAVAVAGTAIALLVQGVYGAARPLPDALLPSLISATLHTRFGQWSVLRLLALGAAGGALMRKLFHPGDDTVARPGRAWIVAGSVTAVVVLATFSLAGHASQGGDAALGTLIDMVHFGAACLWIGGLAVLAAAALRTARPAPDLALLRFSQCALLAATAIAASGFVAVLRQVGSLAALTGTDYGRLVLAKIAVFVALVAFGAVSRRSVHGRLALTPGSRQEAPAAPVTSAGAGAVAVMARPEASRVSRVSLRRTVAIELGLSAVVLVLTALLVNARPARQAYVPAVSATTTAGPTKVRIAMPAARAGAVQLRLLAEDGATGRPLAVPEIDATLSLLGTAGGAVDDLNVPLRAEGGGRYTAVGLDVPIPGRWKLDLTVRTDEIDEYYADPVTIRFR